MKIMGTLSNIKKNRVDGCVLIGFQMEDKCIYTKIDESIPIQMVYAYTKPIAKRRSIDGENGNILTIHPKSETFPRFREWYENGQLNPPEDTTIDEGTLRLMEQVNGNDDGTEIQIPPLDERGAEICRNAVPNGTNLIGGVGREPLINNE